MWQNVQLIRLPTDGSTVSSVDRQTDGEGMPITCSCLTPEHRAHEIRVQILFFETLWKQATLGKRSHMMENIKMKLKVACVDNFTELSGDKGPCRL
jgi:hypothetical protein